jgi:hypothetical protein
MKINIIKDPSFFESLKYLNQKIEGLSSNFTYNKPGEEYDLPNGRISLWFNPKNVRDLGLSRTYPHMDACQYRPEYSLIIHCSNYLALFLMKQLYSSRKDVLFEDVGAGMGWLYLYLQALGFNNFHSVDNFSQISEKACRFFSDAHNLNVRFNQLDLTPIISNNVACPLMPRFTSGLELIINSTNPSAVEYLKSNADKNNFQFLCVDSDNLTISYCREDKYREFSCILERYKDE